MPTPTKPTPPAPRPSPDDPLALRALAVQLALGLVLLLLLVTIAGLTLRAPLTVLSHRFVDAFGIEGIFFGVLLLDSVPFTIHEPLLFFGLSGDLGFAQVFLAAGSASFLSGGVGYLAGRLVGPTALVQRLLLRYRIPEFLDRYGAVAIAVAALTPFPFAVATWGAGASRMRLRHLVLGAAFRFVKVFLYLLLIDIGWMGFA